jgi:predicted outer membrane protein
MARASGSGRCRRWAAAALVGFVGGLVTLSSGATAAPAAPPGSALNATDIALLNGVRLAGLWEMPAGLMAEQKGYSARVREIGAEIAKQHVELDELAVVAATSLGAAIPADPTPEQQGWLKEMSNASGPRFDRIFVDRLRAAHGKIFPIIGAVRTGTRNADIRKLAQAANTFVENHMTMLESTGLVRYNELPAAPVDDTTLAIARSITPVGPGVNQYVIWAVLLAVLAMAGLATVQVFVRR